MGRKQMVAVDCTRCGRTDMQSTAEVYEVTVESPATAPTFEFSITFRGETVTYDDLCRKCREFMKNSFDRIATVTPESRLKHKSGGEEGEQKTPVVPPGFHG